MGLFTFLSLAIELPGKNFMGHSINKGRYNYLKTTGQKPILSFPAKESTNQINF